MAVMLDSKDLALIDKALSVESKVFDILKTGRKEISDGDFVGVREVRINKMSGFTQAEYQRNGTNASVAIDVDKETRKLEYQMWTGYKVDKLDQDENAGLTYSNIIEGHRRNVLIPFRDQVAVQTLITNAGTTVTEAITSANSLDAFDNARAVLTDNETPGQLIMFASTAYVKALRNNDKISHIFTTNTVSMDGIDRRVHTLDDDIMVIEVPQKRLQFIPKEDGTATEERTNKVNFILTGLDLIAPITKLNTVDIIPPEYDNAGYKSTIKGIDYFDCIVLDNAKKGIYVSVSGVAPTKAEIKAAKAAAEAEAKA